MSKVFHFLYFLTITLFVLTLLIIKTEPVFADQSNFTVTQIPNPFSIDNQDISITVKTKDDSDYFMENKYSFAAWTGTLNKGASCTKFNFRGVLSDELKWNKKQATAKWQILANCAAVGDEWHFRLWRGEGWDDMNNNIIREYSFIITQSGGQLITITAKSSDVYIGEKPIVVLSNTAPNADYTFWWEGEWKDIAGYYSRDKNPKNPLEVIIPQFPIDTLSRKLCAEYGNSRVPPVGNNSCNIPGKFAVFNFINKQRSAPSGPVKCTILPSNSLPLNSKADIKIENVPSNTEVFAYATNNDTGNQWSTSHGTSDSTYTATLTLINNGTAGSYTAVAYSEADPSTNLCVPNPTFKISDNPAPPAPSPTSCTDPKTCTSGGGKLVEGCSDPNKPGYDPNNPGIATAIGCIHTNPAELVKDFMTWVLGIGGGLAFLMMLLGAFQMLSSAGNPETLNAGRERLTSAVIGLLFVIFAVLLLQIIGAGILSIPGFGP